ncbi:MAG: ABC transporter permease [Bdellovibrionales bacterium]|nr:ABC transporter permease [Bdellovibrionales bacterium]
MENWYTTSSAEGARVLELRGKWRMACLGDIEAALADLDVGTESWTIDGSALDELDTAGAMVAVCHLQAASSIALKNFSPAHRSVFELVHDCVEPPRDISRPALFGFLGSIGEATFELTRTVLAMLHFIGHTAVELARALVQPRLLRGKEFAVQLETVGLNAIPIVMLVNFLIGIVIAYLSGVQLEYYGANIFVVDGVGLAVVRELSPILAAIIVAGRSGSAFTAQLGAMKLNEEVDAISALGLSPHRVLVIPRLLALMIAMPILVFVGDIAGILGGLVIADFRLGVSGAVFLERLQERLALQHVFVGLVKAPAFAFFIATIGCRMGLAVENNARSVGLNTTATVVRSIVIVILLNAAFAVVFSELGI